MIKSQEKLAQITHSILREEFEKEIKHLSRNSLSEDQEEVIGERILASILKAELSEQFQDNLSISKLIKDF